MGTGLLSLVYVISYWNYWSYTKSYDQLAIMSCCDDASKGRFVGIRDYHLDIFICHSRYPIGVNPRIITRCLDSDRPRRIRDSDPTGVDHS